MPARSQTPKNNVVSFRVNDAEKSILDKLSSAKRAKISDICHDAMKLYLDTLQQPGNKMRIRKAA